MMTDIVDIEEVEIEANAEPFERHSLYVLRGNTLRVTDRENLVIVDEIPVGVWALDLDLGGYYLEKMDPFVMPKKMYGDANANAERILKKFRLRAENDRKSTGVLLIGSAGGGKSMLAKAVAMKSGCPIILVQKPFSGSQFTAWVQGLKQSCIILFDEFEKVYAPDKDGNKEAQEGLLSLFDGMYNTQHLFLLTINERFKVNSYLLNRPGRMFYCKEYKGVPIDIVREIAVDNDLSAENVEKVVTYSCLLEPFTFDMLTSLISEIKDFPELGFEEIVSMLNVKPGFAIFADTKFEVSVTVDGKPMALTYPDNLYNNPLLSSGYVHFTFPARNKKEEPQTLSISFNGNNIASADPVEGSYVFKGSNSAYKWLPTDAGKWELTFNRKKVEPVTWNAAMGGHNLAM